MWIMSFFRLPWIVLRNYFFLDQLFLEILYSIVLHGGGGSVQSTSWDLADVQPACTVSATSDTAASQEDTPSHTEHVKLALWMQWTMPKLVAKVR